MLLWDHQNSSLNLALNLNGHNFTFVGLITLILCFSGSLERGLSDDVLNQKSKLSEFGPSELF